MNKRNILEILLKTEYLAGGRIGWVEVAVVSNLEVVTLLIAFFF